MDNNDNNVSFIVGASIGGVLMISVFVLVLWSYWKHQKLSKLIKDIGRTAEQKINDDLKVWAKYTNNKFIDSHLYKYNADVFFEVDSVLVTKKGLIIVEIKSIRGGVEGKANDLKWQKIHQEKASYITNAIIQNDKHINHVMEILNEHVPIVSLIVYSNKTQYFKIDDVPSHVVITRHTDLFDTLDQLNSSLKEVLSDAQTKKLYSKLMSCTTKNESDFLRFKEITNQRIIEK